MLVAQEQGLSHVLQRVLFPWMDDEVSDVCHGASINNLEVLRPEVGLPIGVGAEVV